MKQKQFQDLRELFEGLVLLGCGGKLEEWETGVLGLLEEEKIATKDDFDEVFFIVTSGGRTDVVLPFKRQSKINIGKLAIWRLRFGNCSWVSDYLVNYASHHGGITKEFEDEFEDEESDDE